MKLPAARVEELVTQGLGAAFDPGHGRIQREWLELLSGAPHDWLAMAIESEAFVASPL